MSEFFVVAGCSTAAAQVMDASDAHRFRVCIHRWVTGLEWALSTWAQRSCCCQITAFTAALLVCHWQRPAPFTSRPGSPRLLLPDLQDTRTLSICPSTAPHRHSTSCTSSNSNDNRSSKGTPGTDPIKQTACIAPSRSPTTYATWRCRRQGQTGPTAPLTNDHVWCGRSSASHFCHSGGTLRSGSTMLVSDATAMPSLAPDMCCVQLMHAIWRYSGVRAVFVQHTQQKSVNDL